MATIFTRGEAAETSRAAPVPRPPHPIMPTLNTSEPAAWAKFVPSDDIIAAAETTAVVLITSRREGLFSACIMVLKKVFQFFDHAPPSHRYAGERAGER